MGLKDRIVQRFFGDVVEAQVEAGVKAHLEETRQAATARDREVEGFRRLSHAERDLSPLTHDRQRELAVYLYTYNPLARRLMETIREWILGEGVSVTSPHPRTSEFLDRWWTDRVNRWDRRLWQQAHELYLMGERFWPVARPAYSGSLRFGTIDPAAVKEVVVDSQNVETTLGVVLKAPVGSKEKRLRVVAAPEDLELMSPAALRERERFNDGELFTFAVNKLSTQTRGVSELFSAADWLDGYEQLLFAILQREQANANIIWDVTLEGADEAKVEEFRSKMGYPKPNSVRVHNEKVKYELVGPAFGSSTNNVEHARMFRNHVLGGGAIPEHWFGGGGDVNRATASEMAGPTEKSLTAKQRTIKEIMEDVISTQIGLWVASGELSASDEDARLFELTFPELSTRDLSKVASTVQGLAGGLAIYAREGWVDDELPVRVLASVLQQVGVDEDPQELLDRARDKKAQTLVDEASSAMERQAPTREEMG